MVCLGDIRVNTLYKGDKDNNNNNNNNNREVAQLTETLKQKVQAKAQRISRYDQMENQCTQNRVLKEDTKKFYRNLDMRNIEVRQLAFVAEVEPYWKSM